MEYRRNTPKYASCSKHKCEDLPTVGSVRNDFTIAFQDAWRRYRGKLRLYNVSLQRVANMISLVGAVFLIGRSQFVWFGVGHALSGNGEWTRLFGLVHYGLNFLSDAFPIRADRLPVR